MRPLILFSLLSAAFTANAQTMTLSLSSDDFVVTPVFSLVETFAIDIEINAPLAVSNYVNPDIVSVSYSVSGTLEPGTPSGFKAFALQRDITGTEFYAQGSSLSFQVATNAVLSDGVQSAELTGAGIVFTFNGREVGNGRFHPALLELNADGTGRIQNSDNITSENPFQQNDFGDEYITDLLFDPGNTTILTGALPVPPIRLGGGSGAMGLTEIAVILFVVFVLLVLRITRQRSKAAKLARDSKIP